MKTLVYLKAGYVIFSLMRMIAVLPESGKRNMGYNELNN